MSNNVAPISAELIGRFPIRKNQLGLWISSGLPWPASSEEFPPASCNSFASGMEALAVCGTLNAGISNERIKGLRLALEAILAAGEHTADAVVIDAHLWAALVDQAKHAIAKAEGGS